MATKTEQNAGDSSEAPQAPAPSKGSVLGFFRDLPGLILLSFVVALLIKTFLVQAFFIPSGSMEPTLEPGDRVLVNRVVFHLRDIHEGDVVVFQNPHPQTETHRNPAEAFLHWLTDGLGLTRSADEDFIKRVIGLPGDTVEGHDGSVYVNGRKADEPYLTQPTADFPPFHVPQGDLFVMGDNRSNSLDSRFGLGFVPIDKVVGKAFVVIWPPSRIRLLH